MRLELLEFEQSLHIEQVFGAGSSGLVLNELSASEERDGPACDSEFDSAAPGCSEVDTADTGQHIDASRRKAELVDISRSREVDLGHLMLRKWCTEGSESGNDLGRIGLVRTNEDIEVSRCPGNAVGREGMRAYDDELDAVSAELEQQVEEIGIEPLFDGHLPPLRTMWPGASRRS
ncbi:MAG: hypothetical protein ABTQ32_36095 [Myxococcaceae bacterium]